MNPKKEKVVYFIRHGQSIDNASPVFQSVLSPLSEEGRRQAGNIADRLSTIPFETLIASPVERAKETAHYISDKTGKNIAFSDLFVERVKPSEIDGKPWTDKQALRTWRQWKETLTASGKRVGDGENFDDITARVDKAFKYLMDRPEQTMAVVTHGYFLRAMVARILVGDSLSGPIMRQFQNRASIENTAITVLHYSQAFEDDFAWRLLTFNDLSHLVGKL